MVKRDHGHLVDEARQCKATVKGGHRQCLNPPIVGRDYCGTHGGLPPLSASEKDVRRELAGSLLETQFAGSFGTLAQYLKCPPEDTVAILKEQRKAKATRELLDKVIPRLTEIRKLL